MVECCPHCGSVHFIKYELTNKGRQKYRCKDCNKIFGPTTKTIFAYSNTSYQDWITFIACEINGQTLEQEEVAIGKSKTTCFNMHHKLYSAVKKIQEGILLKGDVQLDPTYTKINLKGTKTQNMPRISKRRGRKSTCYQHSNEFKYSHRICLITAKDEYDTFLFKAAGLGQESDEKLNQFIEYFDPKCTIISDNRVSIKNFAANNGMKSEPILSSKDQKRHTTNKGNSIAEINRLHQQFSEIITRKHGISTRHIQGYLDWLVFCKKIKYTVENRKRKVESYVEIMKEYTSITTREISKKPLPVDLYEAYSEYSYGIYSTYLQFD